MLPYQPLKSNFREKQNYISKVSEFSNTSTIGCYCETQSRNNAGDNARHDNAFHRTRYTTFAYYVMTKETQMR